jgi:3-hydroxyisobutyrate dehydrogenase-like beta-hydroxyacid dehydrogenase
MRIGFVGLGHMGRPMALRLLKAGHEVVVLSRSPGPVEALVAAGASAARSPADLAGQVDMLGACLLTADQCETVFLGPNGIVEGGRRELLCIDFATIDPMTSRKIGAALAIHGIGYLDAPVSGGPAGAAEGTLSIIVGGAEADVQRARPMLDQLGSKVFHMGPLGAGVSAKLCNNMVTITVHALLAEAMVLGTKAGIDPARLYEVLRSSSARSNTLERCVPNFFLPRNFEPQSTVISAIKDLESAIATAKALGVRTLLPVVAQQCYVEATGLGHGGKDISAVILPMEQIAGVEVGSAKPV